MREGGAEDGCFGVDGGEDLLVERLVLAQNQDGVLAHLGRGEEFGVRFLAGEVEPELEGRGWFFVLRSWFLVWEIDADVEVA